MKKLVRPLGALVFILLLCLNPAQTADAAFSALQKWATRVVPSLFPFFAAIPALTCSEARAFFCRFMKRFMAFMKCPGEMAPALMTGVLSGSPAGALATACAAREVMCGETALLRCGILSSGASPAFLLGTVAAGMLADPGAGWLLIGAQNLGALTAGLLMRFLPEGEKKRVTASGEREASPVMLGAARNLIMIGGYMMLFSVLARQLSLLAGTAAEKPLLMLFELAGGCESAASLDLPRAQRAALLSAVSCMGGLSVCAQSLAFLRPLGVSGGRYVFWKLVQSGFAALYAVHRLQPGWADAAAVLMKTPKIAGSA